MKKYSIMIALFLLGACICHAQTNSNLIEGGKTLVELFKVFKSNKPAALTNTANLATDSCATRNLADLCFKNSSASSLAISIYKRTEAGYEATAFSMKVLAKAEECWYELRAGVYKYKIEIGEAAQKTVFREGELKLQPCDKMEREIKPQ